MSDVGIITSHRQDGPEGGASPRVKLVATLLAFRELSRLSREEGISFGPISFTTATPAEIAVVRALGMETGRSHLKMWIEQHAGDRAGMILGELSKSEYVPGSSDRWGIPGRGMLDFNSDHLGPLRLQHHGHASGVLAIRELGADSDLAHLFPGTDSWGSPDHLKYSAYQAIAAIALYISTLLPEGMSRTIGDPVAYIFANAQAASGRLAPASVEAILRTTPPDDAVALADAVERSALGRPRWPTLEIEGVETTEDGKYYTVCFTDDGGSLTFERDVLDR